MTGSSKSGPEGRRSFSGCAALKLQSCSKIRKTPRSAGILPAVPRASRPRIRRAKTHADRRRDEAAQDKMIMSEVVEKPATENSTPNPRAAPSVDVYAVYGVEPEIQAYAMAKVLALGALHERVAAGNQPAEGREISKHLLLPVRPPLHRRSGAYRAGYRTPVDSGGHRRCRRAALGRAGTLHPLSGFQKERLLHPRLRRCTCGGGRPARPGISEELYRRTVDSLFAEYESLSESMFRLPGRYHAQAGGDEAGSLRPHACGRAPSTSRATCCRWRPIPHWEKSSTRAL